jgi:RND family efflux transporter MFP subunit
MRASIAFVIVAIGCHGGAPEGEAEEARPPAAVTCKAVTPTAVDDVIEVAGQIAPPPRLDAIVSSPVAGRIGQVAVEEGDRVAAGALLVVVEDPALPAGSIEARAQVASAQAAKTAADLEVTRQARLVETGIGAKRDLDDARAKAAAATAELDAANARAGLATRQLARRELRAPYAGVVLHLWKRVGESVDGTGAMPVVEVADTSSLELRAQVAPKSLVAIHDGMAASVRVLGVDAPIAAKVTRVSPAVDPATLLGTVRLGLASATGLPVGSAATGRIVTGTHQGLVIPATALRRSMTGSDEIVVCDGKVARVRAVDVGAREAATVEITKGLAANERVVVDHVLGLDEGQALEVKP